MTALDRYRVRMASEPLTRDQLGAIHREFTRLGFSDRDERLTLTAALARVPGPIGSTKDLVMGDAGRVVGALIGCRTAAELYSLATPEPRGLLAALWAWITG